MQPLITRPIPAENLKTENRYIQLGKILNELEKRQLPQETTNYIDQEVEQLNAVLDTGTSFSKAIKEKENKIIKWIEKKHKIVPKSYYQRLWMVLGMSAFGIPLGVAFGLTIGNLGLLGIGLPIGMGVGVAVGSYLDKKAFTEGRQLDVEIKH